MSRRYSYNHRSFDQNLVIRRATLGDEAALERLSQLEGIPVPAEPLLLAIVDGEAQAAYSIEDGTAIADPFKPTGHLVATLRAHASPASSQAKALSLRGGLLRRAPWPA